APACREASLCAWRPGSGPRQIEAQRQPRHPSPNLSCSSASSSSVVGRNLWQKTRKSSTASLLTQEDGMDNQRGKTAKPQARQKHPAQWQQDLNPGHLAGQNIG